MRKKLLLGLLALVLTSGVVVFGNSPGFIERIVDSLNSRFEGVLNSDEKRAWEIVAKAGHTKRSARKEQLVPYEIPETMLWHVAFDFAKKMEAKAEESAVQGSDGSLFRSYFRRQGRLSEESDKALKELAKKYFEELKPIEERAKSIMDVGRSKSSDISAQLYALNDLKAQKEAATLRHRSLAKDRFGEADFGSFEKFLKGDFSEGAVSGMIEPTGEIAQFSPQGIFVVGWSWIIWDDSTTPPLVTGLSELYFYYVAPIAPYSPSLDTYFVNFTTSTLLNDDTADGYRDWFPAYYFHPVFPSVRGNEYCTLTDFYADLYDGPILIDEIDLGSNGVCHVVGPAPPTPSPTPTPNVTSVILSQVNPSTEGITPNPTVAPHNPGIGQRIFPDKDFPNEDSSMTDRRLVRVTATLSQPIANVPVYFRNFDLDDPATDTAIDGNGTAGNDNRDDDGDPNTGVPRAGQLLFANGCGANGPSVFCPSDANGVATIVFQVSRQPGNNFAIAASISPIAVNGVTINGIELNDSGGQPVVTQNCPTQAICRSQMLTVWRRLHIEVDSMGLSSGNFEVGTSTTSASVRAFGPDVTLNVNTPTPLEVNRFEDGRITFGTNQLRVVSNTATSVTVRNTLPGPSRVTVLVGAGFHLYDDDDFDDSDGNGINGDTGDDISGPDEILPTSGMSLFTAGSDDPATNVFAPAYVRPVYDIANDTRDDCNFVANMLSDDAADLRPIFQQCWDSGASDTDPAFWYVLIYGAYQHTLDEDTDPIGDLTWGIVDEVTGVPAGVEGSGALIFLELLRTNETAGYDPDPAISLNSMSVVVAHEIGHLFSCIHGDGGLLGTDPVAGFPVSSQASETMILKIRRILHP